MIEAMGRGWCFTFHAGVVAGLSPILLVLEKWGPGWREARRVKEEEKKKTRIATSANSSNSVVPTTEHASDSDQEQNHKEKSSGS